jgi:DHA1 family bicyclomycin/chloramphenicol resistance-like MFS transporter
LVVLPETLPASARKARPLIDGARAAGMLLSQRRFVVMALVSGFVQGGMFAFITGSSGVFQGIFGLSALEFGIMFAVIAAALIIFGKVNGVLLNRYNTTQILTAGLPVFVASTVVLASVSSTQSLWVFVLPLWISIGMVGLLSANAMSITMELSGKGAGMGSALLGAVQFAVAFTVSTCVALGGTDTALPMALGLFIPASFATILFFALGGRVQNNPVREELA